MDPNQKPPLSQTAFVPPAPQMPPITPRPPVQPINMAAPLNTSIPKIEKSENSSGKDQKKVVVLIGAVVLVVVVIALLMGFYKNNGAGGIENFTTEKVSVENTGRVPAGFPDFIPVEESGLTETNKINYLERGTTLYSLAFNSAKPAEQLYSEYVTAIKNAKFMITATRKSATELFFQANAGKNSVTITIVPLQNGGAKVQLAYEETK